MELYEVPRPPELGQAVAHGQIRHLHRGPKTIAEVLAEASAAMDAQDEAERREADPVTWLRAERRKRSLFWWLFGRH